MKTKKYLKVGISLIVLAAIVAYFYKELKKEDIIKTSEPLSIYSIIKMQNMSGKEMEASKRIIDILFLNCITMHTLFENGDIDSIKISIHRDVSKWQFQKEKLGWNKYVEINLFIRRGATSYLANAYHMWGHTLYFYAGGDRKPGIISGKETGDILCGMERIDGSAWSTYIKNLDLFFIDSL